MTNAGKLAHYLKKKGYRVDVMLISSANRTQTTAQILMTALGEHPPEVVVSPDLYLATDDRIWTAIQGADQAIETLLIVGHNPGLEALSRRFLPQLTKLHPGQMVRVRFDTDSWHMASELIAQDVKLV